MRNLSREYRDVADDDPGVALMIVFLLLGVLGFGLLLTGVITAYEWWGWAIKLGMTPLALAIDWIIWTFVAYTFRAIDRD